MAQRSKEYDVLCKIGQGSFGQVFKVRRKCDRAILVMKLIKMQSLSKKNQQDSLHEVTILSSLNCPYIVKYYDSFAENNTLYIIMEYCEKGDLSQILKKQHLPPHKIWKFFIQICIGLEYLHSKQILHRDIKCLNIFLSNDDSIRIGDLGVAKILTNTAAFAQTQVGSPYYLSPELCEEKPYNTKSDVWALGCVVYEMCTGKHPFQAPTQAALLLKIISGNYIPLPLDYAENLKEIVDLCLEKDYQKRPSIRMLLQRTEIQNIAAGVKLIIPVSSVLNGLRKSTEEILERNLGDDKKEEGKGKGIFAGRLVEEAKKQILDNRKNIGESAGDAKIQRPYSGNRQDIALENKVSQRYVFNEVQKKREESPQRIRNIVRSKPLIALLKHHISEDKSENNGLLERKSEKDIPHLKRISITNIDQRPSPREQPSSYNIKNISPVKKIPLPENNLVIIPKSESRRENVKENYKQKQDKIKINQAAFKMHFRQQGLIEDAQEEPKQIYRPKVPTSAKVSHPDCSYDDIRLVRELPEIPKIKKNLIIRRIEASTPVKMNNIYTKKLNFQIMKKPLLEPILKYEEYASRPGINRLGKHSQREKVNTSLEEIVLDNTKETEHSNQLRQKEAESLNNREKLQKKCSDMRRDIIKLIGSNVFNEMHNIFTSIISVKNS